MLPDNHGILVQVRDIGATFILGVLLQDHPHEMRVPHALVDAVRVLVRIGPSMVGPMFTAPPADGALYSTATDAGKEYLQRQASVIVGCESASIILRNMMRIYLRFV